MGSKLVGSIHELKSHENVVETHWFLDDMIICGI